MYLIMDKFIEVTKDEYYDSFKNLDAVHTVDDLNGYPYSSVWSLRSSRKVIAKTKPIDNLTEKYLILCKK